MPQHLLVLTTIGSEEEAAGLAKSLVQRRLVACANVGPVRSFFVWQGKLEDEPEYLLLMKTRSDRYADLEAALKELHPYDVPEVIAIPVERGLKSFLSWLDDNVKA